MSASMAMLPEKWRMKNVHEENWFSVGYSRYKQERKYFGQAVHQLLRKNRMSDEETTKSHYQTTGQAHWT